MRVFISYRRLDSQNFVGHLETKLRERLAGVEIFRDSSGIESGDNWKEKIVDKINSSDLMLVIIGPDWLTIEKDETPRLFEADDVVRFEISLALKNATNLIPVLCNRASFPEAEDLPSELVDLAWINAHTVRPSSVDKDINGLIKRIGFILKTTIQELPTPEARNTVDHLLREMGELIASDSKVKDFDSYWTWFLKAKQSLREVATGTQAENEVKRLELLISDAREEDEVGKELTMLEIEETLRSIKTFFSTTQEREKDEESRKAEPSEVILMPGIDIGNFKAIGSWQCSITGGASDTTIYFELAADGTVIGSISDSWQSSHLDGQWFLNIWQPSDKERYVGEPPSRIIGIRLSGILNRKEPYNIELPIGEKVGTGYSGIDDQGRRYFLSREQ